MVTISLCMIVKEEADVLARCLDSIEGIADEIVIVDTGSRDATKEIAHRYTNLVYDFPWDDDFAAARNFSFSKASMAYCLWLDADDVILSEDRKDLLALKQSLSPETDVVMMKYNTSFDAEGKPTFSYFRERLLRRSPLFYWRGAVHEAITPTGNILYADIAITHRKLRSSDTDRNLRIFEKQLSKGISLEPREQFYYGRELYYHGRYLDAQRVLSNFLDEGNGWIENNIEACRFLSYCRYQNGEERGALHALLRSLEFDTPRAEVCCDLGKHFFDRNQLLQAIFWYTLALTRERNDNSGAFVSPDCYGYLPSIELCLCYARLGDDRKAAEYNAQAGRCKPNDPTYLYNKAYFEGKNRSRSDVIL